MMTKRTVDVQGHFYRPDRTNITISRVSGKWPAVHIGPEAHGKMWALVQQSDIEVGWLSSCRLLEDGDFVIDDVFVPKQVCSIVSTTITPDGEAELLGDLLRANRQDIIQSLSVWGHSHVDLQVWPSHIDETQTQTFLRRHMKRGSQFFLRVIANRHGELYCGVYLFGLNLAVHNPVLHAEPFDASLWRLWAAEQLRTKVRRESLARHWYVANAADFELEKVDPLVLQRWLQVGNIDLEVYRQILASKSAAKKNGKKGGSSG